MTSDLFGTLVHLDTL